MVLIFLTSSKCLPPPVVLSVQELYPCCARQLRYHEQKSAGRCVAPDQVWPHSGDRQSKSFSLVTLLTELSCFVDYVMALSLPKLSKGPLAPSHSWCSPIFSISGISAWRHSEYRRGGIASCRNRNTRLQSLVSVDTCYRHVFV